MNRHWKRLLAALAAVATLVLLVVTTALATGTPGVDPASVTASLNPGGSLTVNKVVHTPTIPPNPDLVFLADTTGSMGGAIGNVQANAVNVMNTVLASQPTSNFGAASYKDFDSGCGPDPYVYNTDQALTASTADVQTAINTWSAFGGCDTPEADLYALTQVASSFAWRAGSSRIVAWFGDAPGHDPSGGATLASTIAALQAQNIRVIAVNVGNLDGFGQASAITSATGGVLLPSGGDVSGAILAGLSNLPAEVGWTATCDSGLSVTLTPATQTVPSGDDASFTETISVDPNAAGGSYQCQVSFTINGVPAGDDFVEKITVDVNSAPDCSKASAGPDLWPPNHKLVASSITGVTDADGDPVTVTITGIRQDEPTNGLGDGDTAIDGVIGSGNAFSVRAERAGTGNGRVYHVYFSASDGNGLSCTGEATIGVPHDQGPNGGPVDDGPTYDSTS